MLKFLITATGVDLEYTGDMGGSNTWVWDELTTNKAAQVSRIFSFEPADLLNPPTPTQDFDDYEYRFQFGTFDDGYVKIPARILDIKNDLLISRDVTLKRSIFAAERNVSIFGRLSDLLEHSDPIVIGGKRPDAIPWDVFEDPPARAGDLRGKPGWRPRNSHAAENSAASAVRDHRTNSP